MDKMLKGKTAIITGGSSGVGKATAYKLGKMGAVVILVARNRDKLLKVKEEFKKEGIEVHIQSADVGKEEDVKRVVEEVLSYHKKIDFLINNAGLGFTGAVEDVPIEKYDLMMNTNMRGVFLFTKYVLPAMKKQKDGYIINISSGAGKNGIKNMSVYCASKFAVVGFSEAVALEAKPFDVKVSVICPGSINTNFHNNFRHFSEEDGKTMQQPEDIAETIYHLVTSPKQYWIFELTTRAFLRGRK